LGMLDAIRRYGRPSEISQLLHGTTIATNSLIERKGGEVCYVATKGFKDVPFIGRMNRKSHYDLTWIKPKPLVKRRNCREVEERIDYQGRVLKALNEKELEALASELRSRKDISALAVCFLFSYVNPEHEFKAKEILGKALPHVPMSISFEVCPRWKEYERATTTIADAFVKSIVSVYVDDLVGQFEKHGIPQNVAIMKSNGGLASPDATKESPIETLMSGPAGGVAAGKHIAKLCGVENFVTFDMGGTSTDVSTIVKGREHFTTSYELEWGVPVQIPMVDIRSIGAGGGSIAWVDKGGLLRVGPQSAGADPGPACYDMGGIEPTVTDANLILGRINPDYFLGGEIKLQKNRSLDAVGALAKRLGMTVNEAADAIIRIVNSNMMAALRMVLVEQGYDPRDFSLVAFGGAGPLHCSELVREMRMVNSIVPVEPAAFSAMGFILSDARIDAHRTVQMTSRNYDVERVRAIFRDLKENCSNQLKRQVGAKDIRILAFLEMRYFGQNYELEIPVNLEKLEKQDMQPTFEEFHRLHQKNYGFMIEDEIIEIINFKITATSPTRKPRLRRLKEKRRAEPSDSRKVFFGGKALETPVYRREALGANVKVKGPVIVEERASTTVVPPRHTLCVDGYGNMILSEAR
ncbi:MAG: hydantoinase/oxoprolinase family protein, partial [Candidatus Bathyarchaeia archaeon]